MSYKFSVVNVEDDSVLGFCHKAEILTSNEEGYSVLTLHGFKLTKDVKETSTLAISNLYLKFLSKEGKSLGGYFFVPNKDVKIKTLEFSKQSPIEIIGHFPEKPLPFAFDIWGKLRENSNELRQWTDFSLEEKRAWLQVIRLRRVSSIDRNEQVIIIDGEIIHDIASFYIAIGEAINGPFGYFGASLDGLDDCLCGGFGLIPPFKLEWKAFNKSFREGSVNHDGFVQQLIEILTNRSCEIHLST